MKDYNKPFVLDDTFTISEEVKNMSREQLEVEKKRLEEKARKEKEQLLNNKKSKAV